MGSIIKIILQIEQVLESYCMMFKELEEKTTLPMANVSKKKRKTLKNPKIFFLEGGRLFVDFRFSRGSGNLVPAKS
jgi:hypothetical protein